MSFEDISKKLNAQKLRPRSASSWTRFTVRQIIKWHQANPEVILKREGKVLVYQPWESTNPSESKAINKSKLKRSKRHGTR